MKLYFVVRESDGYLKRHATSGAVGYRRLGTAKAVATNQNKYHPDAWTVKEAEIILKDVEE